MKFPLFNSLSVGSVALIAALAITPASALTVGQWNFEEGTPGNPVAGVNSVLDQSGNANHGSPTGNPIYSGDVAPGTGSASLALDGNGDYVSIAHSATLNLTSAFTVEFRMKAGVAGNSGLRLLVDKSHGFVDSTGWAFQMIDGRMNLNTGAGGGGASNFPGGADTTDLRDDQWHHIAGTYDVTDTGQELKLYIDGMLEGAFSVGTYVGNTRDVVIGAACVFPGCNFSNKRFYNGLIDDLRISNTALTADQFLNASTQVPAPAGIVLFALAAAGLGLKRLQNRN